MLYEGCRTVQHGVMKLRAGMWKQPPPAFEQPPARRWISSVALRWVGVLAAAVVLTAGALIGPSAATAASCAMSGNLLEKVTGDWDGDGDDTVGLYDPETATWYLRNSNAAGAPNLCFRYGTHLDFPVVGDWDGDGTDTVGVVRKTGADGTDWQWILHNRNAGGGGDVEFVYGESHQTPITGDWDGDGDTNIGVVGLHLDHLRWHLRWFNSAGPDSRNFRYGRSWRGNPAQANGQADSPVVGDWDGDGTDTVGVIRWSTDQPDEWHLRNSNTGGNPDITFGFGNISLVDNQPWRSADRMIAGDWNGSGGDGPGHVHWVNSDDPATPGKEINVEWALRDNPSAGPPDRLFRYGVAVGLLRPSPTPL